MKKTITTLSFLCLSIGIFAQGQRPQRQNDHSPEQRLERVTKELDLTKEQVVEWKSIQEKYKSTLKNKATAESSKKLMDGEFEAILTEEQKTKFMKMKKNQGRPPRRK